MRQKILRLLTISNNGIKQILVFMLTGIRPLHKALLGPAFCRYSVTCTEFAIAQVQTSSLPVALWNILVRLIKCNPFNKAVN